LQPAACGARHRRGAASDHRFGDAIGLVLERIIDPSEQQLRLYGQRRRSAEIP
jgi:hypothetical protein